MLLIPLLLAAQGRDSDLVKPTGEYAAGSGGCISPLLPTITNQDGLARAIEAYITQRVPSSPFAQGGSAFVSAGIASGVNPLWIVTIAQKESSFGTKGIATKGTFNAFGRTASNDQPAVVINGRRWYKYPSFIESLPDQAAYLKRVYLDKGLKTFREIVTKYAPPEENDTEKYIKDIETSIGKLVSLAGDSLACAGRSEIVAEGGGKYLNVPGVKEATGGDCGQASVIMVILYYRPGYEDSRYYNPSTKSTKDNLSCVSPAYVNQQTKQNDWGYATASQANLESVKKSLEGGDPVIIYTTAGSIYSNSKHIFVIVGYDPSDDTFYVNNPFIRGVEVHTKTPNGKKMTSQHLKNHFGDSIYHHTFMIKNKYR